MANITDKLAETIHHQVGVRIKGRFLTWVRLIPMCSEAVEVIDCKSTEEALDLVHSDWATTMEQMKTAQDGVKDGGGNVTWRQVWFEDGFWRVGDEPGLKAEALFKVVVAVVPLDDKTKIGSEMGAIITQATDDWCSRVNRGITRTCMSSAGFKPLRLNGFQKLVATAVAMF